MITGKDNPTLKHYKKLSDAVKFRRAEGAFALEGVRLVRDALHMKTPLLYALATAEAMEKYAQALDFDALRKAADGRFYEISPAMAQRLSDTKNPQGVFAAAKTLDKLLSADKIDSNGKYLVLNRIQDPGNLGTMLRTCDAVGISGVILTQDCCDLYNPKTVRATMGSLFRLNLFPDCDYKQAVELLKTAGIAVYAAVPDSSAAEIRSLDFSRPCAVVIGNEGNGLSELDANLCDKKITIAMHGNMDSLNASAAAAILLWEMFR